MVAISFARIALYAFGDRTAMCFGRVNPIRVDNTSLGYRLHFCRKYEWRWTTRREWIKSDFFPIVCKKSDENWISIGMLVETFPTEMAGEYPVFSVQIRILLRE